MYALDKLLTDEQRCPHFTCIHTSDLPEACDRVHLPGGAASSATGKTSSAGPAAAGGAGPLFGGADASNLVVAAPTSTLHIHTSGLVVAAPTAPPVSPHIADINRLARSHKDVSIMFMDIVGERGGGGFGTGCRHLTCNFPYVCYYLSAPAGFTSMSKQVLPHMM